MNINNNFYYTIGNQKIGKDTLIFNMGSATYCPSKALGLCKIEKCYAMKAERFYPQSLPFKQKQACFWTSNNWQVITEYIMQALNKHKGIKFIRFNESGDFYSQSDVLKLKRIATALQVIKPSIVIYGYTARRDLNFDNLPKTLTVNGSSFMISNNFSPYHDNAKIDVVCIGDCRNCDYCKFKHGLNIAVKLH